MIVEFNRPQHPRQVPATVVLQSEPKVFTADLCSRLAALTRAERELRSLGLHVLWCRFTGTTPQVHFQRDAKVSIAGLLDRMGPRSFRKGDDCTVISAELHGVIVSWCEPI